MQQRSMGRIINLHHRPTIEGYLREAPLLHLYETGDLDPFFWPNTTWLGLSEEGVISALCLIYEPKDLAEPTLLAFERQPQDRMERLMTGIQHLLPRRFQAHLSTTLRDCFAEPWQVTDQGLHLKMALARPDQTLAVETDRSAQLTTEDLDELLQLYQRSYPDNWFDQRMLETGHYYGIRIEGQLCAAAGVHVYSEQYGVAALGNITTNPDHRGQGLAREVTAKLCQSLLETNVSSIGLNVKADNRPAIACYQRLGFETVTNFGVYSFVK